MYFITNSDGYIVAASKELLEKIGSRDICSISSALKNKQFSIDSEDKEIKISDSEYLYSISDMYSAFGELSLYNLTAKSELKVDEDDSIEYLKKIKEGSIVKDDENFNIPIINREDNELENVEKLEMTDENSADKKIDMVALAEEKESELKDNKLNLISENKDLIDNQVIDNNIESKELIEIKKDKVQLQDKEVEPTLEDKSFENDSSINILDETDSISNTEKYIGLKDNENITDVIDIQEEIKDENIKDIENEVVKKDEILNIDTEIENITDNVKTEDKDKNENKIAIDESVANLLKDIEDIDVKEDKEEKVDLIQNINSDIHNEEVITHNIKDEIIDIKEDTVEQKDKKGPLSKIKSKLFPWSSSSEDKEIEFEEDNREFGEKDKLESKTESNNENINTELDIFNENKIDNNSNEVKKFTFEDEFDNETDSEDKNLDLLKDIKKNKEKTLDLDKNRNELIEPKEDTNKESEELFETLKDISLEENVLSENNEAKTLIAKESFVDRSDTQNRDIAQEPKDSVKEDILYKLIYMQTNSINLEENAKKLSIDLSNYKLLLENFIDELDNYKDELNSGESSTISMLIDASELLSLNIVTDRLKKLSSKNNSTTISEIDLIKKLLREKLSGKIQSTPKKDNETEIVDTEKIQEEETDNISELFETDKSLATEKNIVETVAKNIEEDKDDVISTTNIVTPPIPEDAIDIISADDLLEKMPLQKIDFEPQRAVNELNLPKTLILEFVNDFISQAKDHLGQLVNAYKQNDIKTLQTTAHMLKGAASNLRLDPIAEVLFKIQKSNSLEDSGELLKKFVANLKGLESEVEAYEKDSNED